jgi:hypothetical protein
MDDFFKQVLTLGGIGAAIQAGKEARNYDSANGIHWINLTGRVVLSAAVAMSAAAVLAIVPGLPFIGQVGLAAGMTVIGVTIIERIADKYLPPKQDKTEEQ